MRSLWLGGGAAYATPLPSGASYQSALLFKAAVTAGSWALDETATNNGDEVLTGNDGWVHFKASTTAGNGTTAGSYPTVAVNSGTFDFSQAGSYETQIRAANPNGRFGFYLGYKDPGHALFIGYDSGGWFWQRYGSDGQWYSGTRVGAPAVNTPVNVKITWDGTNASLAVDGKDAFGSVNYSSMRNFLTNKLALKAGVYGSQITEMFLADSTLPAAQRYTVSGTVTDDQGRALAGARVEIGGTVAIAGADGSYTVNDLLNGTYTAKAYKFGYQDAAREVTVADAAVNNLTFKLQPAAAVPTETLTTPDMTVTVKKTFPAVHSYTMTKLGDAVMAGQVKDSRVVKINGTAVTLTNTDVAFKKMSPTEAQYVLTVKDAAHNIDAELTVQMIAKDNTLKWNNTKLDNLAGDTHPVQTVEFPGLSLVSVASNAADAQFTGARMSSDTARVGDSNFAITSNTKATNADYIYGFVSGDGLSAGLWSNSEHDGTTTATGTVAGGAKNTRVVANTENVDADVSFGLSSASWYYHRVVRDSKGRTYTVPQTDMPKMAVAITGDQNKDGAVNWEDGALAYRSIMNNPYRAEEVPDIVAYRIAMNFGSQAQNPFLTTLDNVKRVALVTDGLGQGVLLKGYANEGHDSGHPDYGDIGFRLGSVADMNTMMEKGAEYGARFGIHVNASEMYPEAKGFTEDTVRRDKNGGMKYGWNWLDQGIGIDAIYDLASGSRERRFADLKSKVGDNLDFIYVDVWGNNTSGVEDSWETRKLSKTIIDNGWRMANEWGVANEYDATFQHWATDLSYGGSGSKGENSQVMRFLRNHQKDSWVGDWPAYGAAAQAPLLGGYNMKDFEGWQGRNDYDAYISNLYTHDVTTKFIQHFTVDRWVNSPLDSTSVKDSATNNGNEQIELSNPAGDKLVLARGSNTLRDPAYRNRTITLNGKVIAQGAVRPGNNDRGQGTESYLLPWNWDTNGRALAAAEEKLYHWNAQGGSTTWELPADWAGLANVKVYKLTDLGKTEETVVPVTAGTVILNADKETPYVVYRGDAAVPPLAVTWSEGMHLVDVGFNGGEQSLKDNWNTTGAGTATIAKSQYSNPMMKTTGSVTASQTLTGLTPGKRYAIYVGVDNRSDGLATMSVTNGTQTLATNSTARSIAKNYVKAYTHSTSSATVDGTSYFQNMYVWFEAPQCGEVTFTLSHEGAGDAYFDDVRVVENNYDGLIEDANGSLVKLTNDFENNAQGIWPFVIGGTEGVEDNRIHLSELHEPYTQAGWDVKKMDDVLQGTWSLKVNGLTQRSNLLYRTVPQNVRFEPGVQYRISFDYQSGSDNIYAAVAGNDDWGSSPVGTQPLVKALGTTKHTAFTVTGAANGQTWFGIYSTATAPDLQGKSGPEADFGGYKDFVLDNLVIERVDPSAHTQAEAIQKLADIKAKYDPQSANYSDAAWNIYLDGLVKAQVLINKDGASADDFAAAYALLESLDTYMPTAPGNDTSDRWDIATADYQVSAGSVEPTAGLPSEGPASLAQDGQANTHWHTAWNSTNLDNAWYQFTLTNPATVDGVRYLPRASGANGNLKNVRIVLTKSDGATVEKTGTFRSAVTWQKISFDAVQDVKSVKLVALNTDGGNASQVDRFASAAELRLTTPRDVPHTVVAPNVDTLKLIIAQVEALKAADYEDAGWVVLNEKLTAAKAAADAAEPDAYAVALSRTNLEAAIADLVLLDPKAQCAVIPDATSNVDPNTGKLLSDTKPYVTVKDIPGVVYEVTVNGRVLKAAADGRYYFDFGQTAKVEATIADNTYHFALNTQTTWSFTAAAVAKPTPGSGSGTATGPGNQGNQAQQSILSKMSDTGSYAALASLVAVLLMVAGMAASAARSRKA